MSLTSNMPGEMVFCLSSEERLLHSRHSSKSLREILCAFGATQVRGVSSWRSNTHAVDLASPTARGLITVTSRQHKAFASSAYHVKKDQGSSFDGLQVCTWIDSATLGGSTVRSGPFCFDDEAGNLPMEGLTIGSHSLSAAVVDADASPGEGILEIISPVTTTSFEVALEEEFIPAYHWKPVHPGQTVPAGLEVVLPLDGSGERRARIPPTWRLQLYIQLGHTGGTIESLKGFFFRTDVCQDTRVGDICKEIASHPRLSLPPDSSVCLLFKGEPLQLDDSAGGTNLFNIKEEIEVVVDINSNCVKQSDVKH
ncbi:unnamed protein product [Choristocarpus tenellus]